MAGVVLLFGRLRDAFGASSIALPEGAGTVAEMRTLLASEYPDLAPLLASRSIRIALNQELVADETTTMISAADEIALLPPLSGG